MIKRIAVPFLIVLIAVPATGVYAGMFSFLKKYDVLLFPAVEGSLNYQGKPLAGLEIIREATYDEVEATTVLTDSNGRFSFPEWLARSSTPGKPLVEARLRQVIAARYEGEYFVLWQYTTDQTDRVPVIAELLKNLNCDLEHKEIDHYFAVPGKPDLSHVVGSVCRWEQASEI